MLSSEELMFLAIIIECCHHSPSRGQKLRLIWHILLSRLVFSFFLFSSFGGGQRRKEILQNWDFFEVWWLSYLKKISKRARISYHEFFSACLTEYKLLPTSLRLNFTELLHFWKYLCKLMFYIHEVTAI